MDRPALVGSLDGAVSESKLVVVSAPAGYGKTSLLASWARASELGIAWVSLGENDNDLERFLRYLFRAWEDVQPEIASLQPGVLLDGKGAEHEAILSAFVNAAHDAPVEIAFVLDDFHLIEDPAIHESTAFLIDNLPESHHVVVVGRGEPQLPLARYRVRNQLTEFGAEDLRFTQAEAEDFLNNQMALRLESDQTIQVQQQLEGWPAGLQLAAHAIRRDPAASGRIAVRGQQRYVADFLSQEVFSQQPDEVQDFLLETSILDRLCGPLCEAVTGRDDGQEVLEQLERQGLFLIPLDDLREWYRYHRVFADFLRKELERKHPGTIAGLHQRATRWYLAHDLAERAFAHGIESGDPELLVEIVDRHYYALLLGGEIATVQRWINAIPDRWFQARTELSIARSAYVLMTRGPQACSQYLDEIEARTTESEEELARQNLARVNAIRCFMACFANDLDQAERYADLAIVDLSEADLNFRPGIFGALGDTYRRHGRWDEARNSYERIIDFPNSPQFRSESAHLYGALADLELRRGRLADAASYWGKALEVVRDRENWGRFPLPVIGWIYIRTGELHYEQNDLDRARDYVARGLERAERSGDPRAIVAGYLIAGRIKLTEGDVDAAAGFLDQARPLAVDSPHPEWLSRFERLQLEVWLAQDRLRAAVHWSDDVLEDGDLLHRPDGEPARLALARALLVRGDPSSRERVAELIERVLRAAERDGRMGVQIEALALQAIVWWMRGDRAEAMVTLERGLRLAEPEGYVRLFADLGPSMVRLLQEARSRDLLSDYVARLLAACGDRAVAVHKVLSEPLTEREHEVLGMISAGLSNAEIADKLFISAETVKKHAGNIYGKLGVHTRTEAASKARELNLLG